MGIRRLETKGAQAPGTRGAQASRGRVTYGTRRQASGARGAGPEARHTSGQMTVELAVAFPVLIAVALIAVNACTFFSECAVFDRVAHEAVRVHATSPAYRQGASQSLALVEDEIRTAMDAPNVDVSVASSATGFDFVRFDATLEFSPTLFGMGLRSEVFGVQLPRLSHTSTYVVDTYKAGVFI